MPSGRPASIRTRRFQRTLSDADVAILAHAGDGDVSAGFRRLLEMYWQSVNTLEKDERSCFNSEAQNKD